MNTKILAIIALVCGIGTTLTSADTIRYSYLMNPSSTGVSVMVHTTDSTSIKDKVKVHYGKTTAYGSVVTAVAAASVSSSPASYVYTVPLSGLSAGTAYHYQVSVDGGTAWGSDAVFSTLPIAGTSFRFAAYSDFRGGTTTHNRLAGKIIGRNPLFVVEAGDMAVDNSWSALNGTYFISNEIALLRKAPLIHAPGNHEGWSGNTKSFFKPSGAGDYGAHECGDLLVININSYVSAGVGSAQYNFIKSKLETSTKTWKIAVFHEPAYTTGTNHGNNGAMQTITKNLLVPNGVAMVINGHNHFYQRIQVSGIQHLVIGAAGAPLYSPGTGTGVMKSAKSNCYGIFDVTPNTLTANIYNGNDSDGLIESFTLTKGTPPPPTTPVASIVATDSSAGESGANTGAFTVTLSPAPTAAKVVSYVITGSAASGADYTALTGTVSVPTTGSATITVTPKIDTLTEGNETVVLTLAAGSGYTVGTTKVATVTIADAGVPPPPPTTFPCRVNMNGVATTIGGNAWTSYSTALSQGLIIVPTPRLSDLKNITPAPAVDANTKTMLNTAIWDPTALSIRKNAPNGNYQVSLWVMENYVTNHRSFKVIIEGVTKATNIGTMAFGAWQKYTYSTTVADGQLTIDLIKVTGEPGLAGLEISLIPSAIASIAQPADMIATWMTTSR